MSALVLFTLLALASIVSYLGARVLGATWTESKIIGGLRLFLVLVGFVMPICGFSWVHLALLTMLVVGSGALSPEGGAVIFELGYLAVILSVLGLALGIIAQGIARAYRRRRFWTPNVTGWIQDSRYRHTWEDAGDAGTFFQDTTMFAHRLTKKYGGVAYRIVLYAIIILFGGVIAALSIARRADRSTAVNLSFDY